jgi:hypothetical protein
LDGEESFEEKMLGEAEEISQERIADDELIIFRVFFDFLLFFFSI